MSFFCSIPVQQLHDLCIRYTHYCGPWVPSCCLKHTYVSITLGISRLCCDVLGCLALGLYFVLLCVVLCSLVLFDLEVTDPWHYSLKRRREQLQYILRADHVVAKQNKCCATSRLFSIFPTYDRVFSLCISHRFARLLFWRRFRKDLPQQPPGWRWETSCCVSERWMCRTQRDSQQWLRSCVITKARRSRSLCSDTEGGGGNPESRIWSWCPRPGMAEVCLACTYFLRESFEMPRQERYILLQNLLVGAETSSGIRVFFWGEQWMGETLSACMRFFPLPFLLLKISWIEMSTMRKSQVASACLDRRMYRHFLVPVCSRHVVWQVFLILICLITFICSCLVILDFHLYCASIFLLEITRLRQTSDFPRERLRLQIFCVK